MSHNVVVIGISIPRALMRKIETERGDMSRSKYIVQGLEKAFNDNDKSKNNSAVGGGPPTAVCTYRRRHSETQRNQGMIQRRLNVNG